MRIISGKYKGRLLKAPAGDLTRPTAAKIKEAIFSMLGSCEGLSVLDLFAGSGQLGLEAMSRGAKKLVLVDSRTAAVLRENTAKVGADGVGIIKADYQAALKRLAGEKFDLVFLDPPYNSDYLDKILPVLPAYLARAAVVVVETVPDKPLPVVGLEVVKRRTYGKTTEIVIYQTAGEQE